jgi:hypothetical protein
VILMPEGPRRETLAADIVEALEAEPEAATFFDEVASFSRKNHLRWIDATKRRPEVRATNLGTCRVDESREEGTTSVAFSQVWRIQR